jgi:TRAP-type C4-dicarboxylate transport system permease small subunit
MSEVSEGGMKVREGMLMIAVAVMVTVSVTMRWLINESVPGDIELVQIGTALAIFSFLPICQARRGNIMVDTFTLRLPRRLQLMLDALWDLAYAGITAIIAWRLGVGAWDTIRSNTVSMMLGLPTGWAIAACAVMAAFLSIVAIATALRLSKGRGA